MNLIGSHWIFAFIRICLDSNVERFSLTHSVHYGVEAIFRASKHSKQAGRKQANFNYWKYVSKQKVIQETIVHFIASIV